MSNVSGKLIKGLAVAALLTGGVFAGSADAADDPAYITVGAGLYDFNGRDDEGGEFRLEYRSDYELGPLKPFAALAGTTTGSTFIGVGLLMDIHMGDHFVLTPSLAPHYYNAGSDTDKDLGHEIEFRSQLEFAYQFDDNSRLGLSVSHYSNAGLGTNNPGSETLMLNFSIPITGGN